MLFSTKITFSRSEDASYAVSTALFFHPQDYLASSSSEDEDDAVEEGGEKGLTNESRIEIYRKLLQGIESKEDGEKKKKLKAGELQVTFEPGLKEKAEKLVQVKGANEWNQCNEYNDYVFFVVVVLKIL